MDGSCAGAPELAVTAELVDFVSVPAASAADRLETEAVASTAKAMLRGRRNRRGHA